MKSKKFMALLLGASLTISTLSGCGGSEKETGKTTEQAAAESTDKGENKSGETKTSDGTDEVSQDTGQALDYEGVTLSVVLAQGWDTPGREALFQKYTDKTGVQFDVQMLPDDMAS